MEYYIWDNKQAVSSYYGPMATVSQPNAFITQVKWSMVPLFMPNWELAGIVEVSSSFELPEQVSRVETWTLDPRKGG